MKIEKGTWYFFEKKKEGPKRYLPRRYFVAFSRLFAAFLSGLFGCLCGLFGAVSKPQPEKEGPTPRGEGQPIPRRETNTPRAKSKKGQTPTLRRNGEPPLRWQQFPPGEGKANPNHKKDGPNTTSRKKVNHHLKKRNAKPTTRRKRPPPTPKIQDQCPPEEGQPRERRSNRPTSRRNGEPPSSSLPKARKANPNHDKHGPNTTSRRPTTTPREDKANPNPKKEGPTSNHEKEKTNPTLLKGRANETRREGKGATPTKACEPSLPNRVAFAISCVTPNLKIENLNVVPDQIRPQILDAIAIAIKIAIAFASICGLMWCRKPSNFQFSIFNFGVCHQIWNLKIESWKFEIFTRQEMRFCFVVGCHFFIFGHCNCNHDCKCNFGRNCNSNYVSIWKCNLSITKNDKKWKWQNNWQTKKTHEEKSWKNDEKWKWQKWGKMKKWRTDTHTHQHTQTGSDTQKTWFHEQPERAICVQISGGSLNRAPHNTYHTSLPPSSQENMLSKKKNERAICVRLSSGSLNHTTHNADHTSLSPSSLFEPRKENMLPRTPNTNPDTEHHKRPPSTWPPNTPPNTQPPDTNAKPNHPTHDPTAQPPNTPTPDPTAQHPTHHVGWPFLLFELN